MSPRRQFVYLAAVLALLAAYDFFGRVHVGRDASMRAAPRHDLVPLPATAGSDEIRKQLGGWLPALAGSAGLNGIDPDATEWQLWLVGVFRQGGERFALIAAQPQGGGETELARLTAGEQVHGATIEAIDGDTVTIREGEEQRELPLFKRGDGSVRPPLAPPPATLVAPSIPAGLLPGQLRPVTPMATPTPKPVPAPTARSTPMPAAPTVSPQRGAGAAPAGRGKVAQPQELKPGEEVKLPWDLPVVEGEPAQPDKKR